jgi:hypothetical protein
MQALDVEEMESFYKIDLKNVSWWMSIKDVCRLGTSLITKISKERCISLVVGGRPFHIAHKHD